MSATKV